MNNSIYKLKVTLLGVRPTVWRRLEVPAGLSLLELHRVIQAAFGWTDSHLHQFLHRGALYGAPDREFGMPMGSERGTRIEDLLERPKDRLLYEYDFGDSWEHDVVLEEVAEAQAALRYPRVVAGKRACPPEDVGGSSGYADFVEAITDAGHDEHDSMLMWVGGHFDPEAFDLVAVNDRVPKKRASRRRDA